MSRSVLLIINFLPHQQQGEGHDGAKPQRAIYIRNDLILTTGFSKMSERQYSLRSESDLGAPIVMETIDTSNGVLYPFYDPDVNLLYLVAKVRISVCVCVTTVLTIVSSSPRATATSGTLR